MTKTFSILVVDDEPRNFNVVEALLGHQGYHLHHAISGKEAIAQVHKHEPDVVVMDLHMPVMDGWTASNTIKKEFPHIKIVAYSAADGGKAQAISNGAMIDAFCDKGACTRSLLEAIKSVA